MTKTEQIFQDISNTKFATDTGTKVHKQLQHISKYPDSTFFKKISADNTLSEFFGPKSRAEVPIAGTINGNFISRRIDRLYINHDKKTIAVIDYKTDICHDTFYNKYIYQINEYITLLKNIYPEYSVTGYILWTHDFLLEKLPIKQI